MYIYAEMVTTIVFFIIESYNTDTFLNNRIVWARLYIGGNTKADFF